MSTNPRRAAEQLVLVGGVGCLNRWVERFPQNRLAALGRLGITDPREAKSGHIVDSRVRILEAVQEGFTLTGGKSSRTTWTPAVNPTTFVLSANVRRRHLSTTQKRDAITAYLEAEPTASDRKIAKELGVSPTTVGDVREHDEGARNVQNGHNAQSPVERAKVVLREDPTLSSRAAARIADVGAVVDSIHEIVRRDWHHDYITFLDRRGYHSVYLYQIVEVA